MIALMRYALLKTTRDGTMWLFLLLPACVGAAVLIGSALAWQRMDIHYPLVMERGWSGVRSASVATQIVTMMGGLLAAVPAFWTLRAEVVSRSIDSMALALRPVVIVTSLVAFTICAVAVAWTLGLLVVALLTAALPLKLGLLALKMLLIAFTIGTLSAVALTISPEPPMLIGIYAVGLFTIPWFDRARFTPILFAPVAAGVIATAIAAFLLERRCAR